jgi:hypothetical protein
MIRFLWSNTNTDGKPEGIIYTINWPNTHSVPLPSSPYYFHHYLKGLSPFYVAALKYSSQASCPYPPANTTDPRVLSLEVAGLFPTCYLHVEQVVFVFCILLFSFLLFGCKQWGPDPSSSEGAQLTVRGGGFLSSGLYYWLFCWLFMFLLSTYTERLAPRKIPPYQIKALNF